MKICMRKLDENVCEYMKNERLLVYNYLVKNPHRWKMTFVIFDRLIICIFQFHKKLLFSRKTPSINFKLSVQTN